MERYLGIDVHRDSSTVCVLSASGKRVRRDLVETNGKALVGYLRQLNGTLHVCIEESTWSGWLYEILSPQVAELVVYQAPWTPGAKSDSIDAQGLAEKLRIGQTGPGVFKAPKRFQKLREWARVYQMLSRDTARAKIRLKTQFHRRGMRCVGTAVYDPCGFGVVTRTSSDWIQTPQGWQRSRTVQTRGLNRNHNPVLKNIFKSAAITAISQTKADHPLRATYARLCDAGTRPNLAQITIARKLAAAVLAMWKKEEVYRPVS